MLEISAADMMTWFGRFWWPLIRLGGLVSVMPILGAPDIPPRIKMALIVIISWIAAPLLPEMPLVDPLSIKGVLLAIEQLLIGFFLGLFLFSLIQVVGVIGQMLAMQMGLSMAMMNDPVNGGSVPVIGTYYTTMASLLFLAQDAHLAALDLLIDSFRIWPVGSGLSGLDLVKIINLYSWILNSALTLAIPAIFAMYLVNFTFGVFSKIAPSLNIFALGFPFTMICGLFCVIISFDGLPKSFVTLTHEIFAASREFLGG